MRCLVFPLQLLQLTSNEIIVLSPKSIILMFARIHNLERFSKVSDLHMMCFQVHKQETSMTVHFNLAKMVPIHGGQIQPTIMHNWMRKQSGYIGGQSYGGECVVRSTGSNMKQPHSTKMKHTQARWKKKKKKIFQMKREDHSLKS